MLNKQTFSAMRDGEQKNIIKEINDYWEIRVQWRQESLDVITKQLFVLNSGGLLSSLTYFVSKKSENDVKIIISIFFIGLLCNILRGGIDYYASEVNLYYLGKKVTSFYNNRIDNKALNNALHIKSFMWVDILLHILGWLSALLFISGCILSIGKV